MTTAIDQQTSPSTRETVHARLLDGARPRDIEMELGISGASVAKNIAALRRDGFIVAAPAALRVGGVWSDPSGGGVGCFRDPVDQFPVRLWFWKRLRAPIRPPVIGWLTAVQIPKQINPDERGPHGHTDWLLMVSNDHVEVRGWVHMRGQRISERQVAHRLETIDYAPAARLVALGLSHLTGLEVVLEGTPHVEQ